MPRKSTKPAAKAAETAAVEAIEPKAEEIKTEVIAEPKETEAVKAPAKKSAAGTAKAAKTTKTTKGTRTAKAAKTEEPKAEEVKVEEPKTEEPKAEAPKAKKAPARAKKNVESVLHVQYGGRSYSQEDLMNIARDVWKYDLKRKEGELESVELYVKPEENKVYYVMNGESGSFSI